MEVTYADRNRRDIGIIQGCEFDLAFGKDENDFSLTIDLNENCMEDGYFVYVEGTEYGGIVDKICPDTEEDTIEYQGRTWHGILEGKVLEPDQGEDYLIVDGEANDVLKQLLSRMGLDDLFCVTEEISNIQIRHYKFNRYEKGYTGIRKMLYTFLGKLEITYTNRQVRLAAVPLYDYSKDEEWDSSQISFSISKDYRPVNHLICLGSGDLKDRKVIHLFTDANGGIQPYKKVECPYKDGHYILDKSMQVLKGQDEVTDIYDYSNADVTENYVLLSSAPSNWPEVCINYYTKDGDSFSLVEKETEDVYSLLNTKPSDWDYNFGSYYFKNGDEYESPEGTESESYIIQTKKPSDWDLNYSDYFYYYSDGLTWEYKNVDGVSNERYVAQTMQPSDWSSTYKNYYVLVPGYQYVYIRKVKQKDGTWEKTTVTKDNKVDNIKTSTEILTFQKQIVAKYEYQSLDQDKAPTWIAKKYYTKESYITPPGWKANYYYTKVTAVNPPEFVAGKYCTHQTIVVIPPWKSNTYYELYHDYYAELIAGGLEKMEEYKNCDELNSELNSDYEYDVGDIVGAREAVTGIFVSQPVTKKIVKIEKQIESITYEIGE